MLPGSCRAGPLPAAAPVNATQRARARSWDAACCGLILYVTLTLPPQVAFVEGGEIGVMRSIDVALDCLFFIDVYVNFRTGALLATGRASVPSRHAGAA